MTVKEKIYAILEEALGQAIKEGVFTDTGYPAIKIEYPKDTKFGDYATPFAMESARVLRRSPMDTGNALKPYLENNTGIIDRVDVVKPGFINIFISHDYLCSNLQEILNEDKNYGKRKKENPQRINIEFVSANPTGPMNVVSARAAALGDTIGNLFEACGDVVEREFYVNDFGNQVNLLGQSVLARVREHLGRDFSFPEDGYHGEYIKDIARHIIDSFSTEFEAISGEEDLITFCSEKAVEYNVGGQKKDLQDFNVNFSRWFHERTLHEEGAVEATFNDLEKNDVIYERENKKFFRSTDYNDDKDRVVIRDDGRPTYLLADIAYHRNKINRNYDRIIDIWGPDHHGYIARLAGAMQALGFPQDRFKILISQQVNLVMEGEAVKMSKRLGRFSTMRELVDEIGVDVARYFFLMRSMDSHLDFDLVLAKKQSSENPVFYLQYAHARICSIFREAEKRGISYKPGIINKELLNNDESSALMKHMMKYPEEVIDAAETIEPHKIPTYLLRLAQAFHRFYTEHRVLSEEAEMTNTYLTLADAVRTVLRNGLNLLGVSAPEQM
ncbi:MAG: arginine--tRNA ligase [Spirochaetae bacterium HGW-Spirochaetae-1]|nr:MAG: arginine--tRNA ligase [Spirochaetae bacterium HGW-Spirochaetae-1]